MTALVIVVPVVLATGVALSVLMLSIDVGSDVNAQIEIIRTSLAVGGGTAGIVALVLAGRRQWSNERSSHATEHDATERRITELYTKAIEQLGSSEATVRLGGLYALERLGQNTESQREAIFNVIRAYLRMPYTPPGDRPEPDASPAEHDQFPRHLPTAAVRNNVKRCRERQIHLEAYRVSV